MARSFTSPCRRSAGTELDERRGNRVRVTGNRNSLFAFGFGQDYTFFVLLPFPLKSENQNRGVDAVHVTDGLRASREFLESQSNAGLASVTFQVDVTQGRKGYLTESDLNIVRQRIRVRIRRAAAPDSRIKSIGYA
jgi:hypothetical protein